MILLIIFDLPRGTSTERKDATNFQKRLVRLGFVMKQYSVYEREMRKSKSVERIVDIIHEQLPKKGSITLYQLPNEVNNNQIRILGDGEIITYKPGPKIIIL